MVLLTSNQTRREKYRVVVQNKFEVLGEAEEKDQQWIKFTVTVTEVAVETTCTKSGQEDKSKIMWMVEDIVHLIEKGGK